MNKIRQETAVQECTAVFSLQGESENLPIVSKHGNCLILIKNSDGIFMVRFVKMHKEEQKCAK